MKRAAVLVLLMLLPTAVLAVNYTVVPENPVRIVPLNTQAELNVYVTNLEPTDQDFTLIKSSQLPSENWQTSICVNGLCYAPFFDTIGVTVAAGDKDTVGVWISAYVDEGSGEALLRIIPVSDPGNEKTQIFAGITNGVDVVVVDDDGGLSYQSYYTDAIPSGTIYGRWPRIADGPTASELAQIGRVIWFTGEASPSLDAGDRTALSTFLDGGGKLLLSGQNIAYSLCDPGSAEYSAAAAAFVTGYLHAAYGTNNSGTTSVVGAVLNPIGSGLSFSIAGGAGNQSSPDGVTPNSGDEALKYQSTAYSASISSFAGSRRVVFFAFGLEGITSLSTRQTLISRTFDYFDATVGVAAGDAEVPRPASLSPNRPNPFNPTTRLSVVLDRAGRANVSVLDASGRHVRTLADGLFAAGETEVVWDGTNDVSSPVRSGVYFVRLNAGEQEVTRKVSLIR